MNYHHAMYLIGLADMILFHHDTFDEWGYDKWNHVLNFLFQIGLITQDIDCDGHNGNGGYYLTVTGFYNKLNDIVYPIPMEI